jgi:hypothetical protein
MAGPLVRRLFLRTGEHDVATARQMLHALGAVLRWDPKQRSPIQVVRRRVSP